MINTQLGYPMDQSFGKYDRDNLDGPSVGMVAVHFCHSAFILMGCASLTYNTNVILVIRYNLLWGGHPREKDSICLADLSQGSYEAGHLENLCMDWDFRNHFMQNEIAYALKTPHVVFLFGRPIEKALALRNQWNVPMSIFFDLMTWPLT